MGEVQGEERKSWDKVGEIITILLANIYCVLSIAKHNA